MSTPKDIILLGSLPEHLDPAQSKLSEQGVSIRQIEGPYRLVAAFATAPADVLLMDLSGLRRQDLEVIQVLREIHPALGIVALADGEQRDLAAHALCEGADLYLLKPIQPPVLLAAIDRAAMRRRLAEAKRQDKTRSDSLFGLAQFVAHEINNPLTTISGWLQVLAADHAENKQLANVLGSMKEEADRIADIVRQLQVFAQQGPPRADPVDITELLTELGRLYSSKCLEKGAQFVTDIAPQLPPVPGDEEQLRRAFDTVLAEAEARVNGTGKIEVSCKPERNGVEIVFRDNGPRISGETLKDLFGAFHNGRHGTAKGMGLNLSRGIIQSHGGTIEASSTESEGTRFTVWLPSQR